MTGKPFERVPQCAVTRRLIIELSLIYRGNAWTITVVIHSAYTMMMRLESKLTSQGQISIPARIRQKLGLGPGSRVEWCERGEEVIVRRASKYSSQDIHDALFSTPPKARDVDQMDDGIRAHLREKHARH